MSNIGMVLRCTLYGNTLVPKKIIRIVHTNQLFFSIIFFLHTFQLSSEKLRFQTKEFSSTKHKSNGSFASMTIQCAYAPPTAFLSEVSMCSLEVWCVFYPKFLESGLPEVSRSFSEISKIFVNSFSSTPNCRSSSEKSLKKDVLLCWKFCKKNKEKNLVSYWFTGDRLLLFRKVLGCNLFCFHGNRTRDVIDCLGLSTFHVLLHDKYLFLELECWLTLRVIELTWM